MVPLELEAAAEEVADKLADAGIKDLDDKVPSNQEDSSIVMGDVVFLPIARSASSSSAPITGTSTTIPSLEVQLIAFSLLKKTTLQEEDVDGTLMESESTMRFSS